MLPNWLITWSRIMAWVNLALAIFLYFMGDSNGAISQAVWAAYCFAIVWVFKRINDYEKRS